MYKKNIPLIIISPQNCFAIICISKSILTLETVVQVFVADDIGRETMTGVTVPAELGDIVNDIVMGCGKPENDTYRKTDYT